MDKKDYYQILEIAKNATDQEVKKAYRNLARKHHPDVDKSAGAHERFKEINEAYQVLSDSKKRQAYDQFGHSAFEQGAGQGQQGSSNGYSYKTYSWGSPGPGEGFDFDFSGFSDPFDIFEMVFGGSSPFGRQQRSPRYILSLEFKEAVKGCEKEVEIDGKKANVKIPAGVDNGSEIRFPDYIIVTQVKADSNFQRQGYDLFTDCEVTFSQAALGATIEIPTIEGRVKLKVQQGTQSGTRIRLRQQGVPHVRGGGRGDQYVRIIVKIPDKLSREEKSLIEQLAKLD